MPDPAGPVTVTVLPNVAASAVVPDARSAIISRESWTESWPPHSGPAQDTGTDGARSAHHALSSWAALRTSPKYSARAAASNCHGALLCRQERDGDPVRRSVPSGVGFLARESPCAASRAGAGTAGAGQLVGTAAVACVGDEPTRLA